VYSAIYRGWVGHHRRKPKPHRFAYPLTLFYLDLDEIPLLQNHAKIGTGRRWRPIQFRRSDYLAPSDLPLKTAVLNLVETRLAIRPEGAVRMLTNLRYFGLCFNPVSFYFCFDNSDRVQAVVAEINNTPWGERYSYALRTDRTDRRGRFHLRKKFHVSPFMPMDMDYDWRFGEPGQKLSVSMINRHAGEKIFSAHLQLTRKPLTADAVRSLVRQFPWQTHRILLAIYWQAFRLYLKRTPFHNHPKHSRSQSIEGDIV